MDSVASRQLSTYSYWCLRAVKLVNSPLIYVFLWLTPCPGRILVEFTKQLCERSVSVLEASCSSPYTNTIQRHWLLLDVLPASARVHTIRSAPSDLDITKPAHHGFALTLEQCQVPWRLYTMRLCSRLEKILVLLFQVS